MNSAEVLAHYETALAAEQTWLAENQELLYRRQGLALGTQCVQRPSGESPLLYVRRPVLRRPLPSCSLVEDMLGNLSSAYPAEERRLAKSVLEDTLQQTLPGSIDGARYTLRRKHDMSEYCPDAERTFAMGIRQVLRTPNFTSEGAKHMKQGRMSVYHARDGKPLFLRKNRFSSTAILLEPIRLKIPKVGQIAIPRGAIAGITTGNDTQKTKTGEAKSASGINLQTHEINKRELGVNPLRLSTWAHDDPLDRAMFSISFDREKPRFDRADWDTYGDIEPKHIDQAAQRIMELCAVAA